MPHQRWVNRRCRCDASTLLAGRLAQFLLGAVLGAFQFIAVIGFAATDQNFSAMDWLVAAWALPMSAACAVVAVRVYRSARARQIAFALLALQTLFSLVKLTVYHESASLVFIAIIAVTATALAMYHRGSLSSSISQPEAQ